MGVTGTYVRGIFDPSNDFIGVPTDDFNAYGGSLSLIRNINRRTKGFVKFTYSHLAYDNGPIVSTVEAGTRQLVLNEDYDVYSPEIGVEYAIEEDITVTASAGYFRQVPDITDTQDGWVLNLLLRKAFKRGGVRFEGGAGYDYSYFTSQNLGFTQFYRAGVTGNYEIFRRFFGTHTGLTAAANIWTNSPSAMMIDTWPVAASPGSRPAGLPFVWATRSIKSIPP